MSVFFFHFRMRLIFYTVLLWTMLSGLAATAERNSNPGAVEFNRDILPILSDKCFACHGPDKASRKTPLRFDNEEGAFVDLGDGRFAIVRGEPDKSEMIRRVS